MAEQVVSLALQNIRDLLVEEAKFLLGVSDEVIELEKQLILLKSYLKDADARSHEEERVRIWLQQAKQLAYRTEDVLEEYAVKVSLKKGKHGFKQKARRVFCIIGEGGAVHKVGLEISKIKKEIVDLIAGLQTYGINQIIEKQPSEEEMEKRRLLRTTYGHEVQQFFVGMGEDLIKLVRWSVEDTMIRRVISICGIGGLGKTTLARKVFNDHQVTEYFEATAWVCITQQCNTKSILQDILIQFLGDKENDNIRSMEEIQIVRKLYKFQKEKKCLVVMDDMWTLVDWKMLHSAFPIADSTSKSKILITTRNIEVADIAHHSSIHKPSCLDKEDAWILLKKTALLDLKKTKVRQFHSVEKLGREMVEKCGCLPLAISTIGGVLRNKNPETEWAWVNKEIDKYLTKTEGVMSILALSYDALPFYLKPCFLYMGSFRENVNIETTHLYHLWMGEGFVSLRGRRPDESLMDVAQEYLKELAYRNMVQVDMEDMVTPVSRIWHCKLHDLIRDLCLAKGKEEYFSQIRSMGSNEKVATSSSVDQDLCRLTIMLDHKSNTGRIIDMDKVTNRYLKALYVSVPYYHASIKGSINLKMLRSLILDYCEFKDKKLPRQISEMIHLRLLSLNHCGLEELPSFVANLTNLQILRADNHLCLFPDIFYQMEKLRYLELPVRRNLVSSSVEGLKFDGLDELESFHGFNSKYDEYTNLSNLVNVRDFSGVLYGCEVLSTFLKQISHWKKLQFMNIHVYGPEHDSHLQIDHQSNFAIVKELFKCSVECRLEIRCQIGFLPGYEAHLCCNLTHLVLANTFILGDPMEFLKGLPNLKDLSFIGYSFLGKEMICDSQAFPKLKSIVLNRVPNIGILKLDAGAMPNLSKITIEYCPPF